MDKNNSLEKYNHSLSRVNKQISVTNKLLSKIGNKKKTDLTKLNLKGKVKSLTESNFDTMNKFGEIQKEVITSKEITLFNKKGNKIEFDVYKSDGSLSYKYTYKYDDNGNKLEENYYESEGILYFKNIYQYDDKENEIEYNTYMPDGSFSYKHTYNYDDKGNKIKETFYSLLYGSSHTNFTYKYDDKGNKIEQNDYHPSGSLIYKNTYKYDDKGNNIEHNVYNSTNGRLIGNYTYKYESDKTGNWIKKTEYKNNIIISVTEREIEYYSN